MCSHQKDEIERLIQENRLSKYVARQMRTKDDRRDNRRESVGDRHENREELPPHPPLPRNGPQPEKLIIHMIIGGPTEGDFNNARRARLDSMREWETSGSVQPVFKGVRLNSVKMMGCISSVLKLMP